MKLIAIALVALILLGACTETTETTRVKEQQDLYIKTQPEPQFDWSLERHLMVKLYEARNTSVATWSYTVNQYSGAVEWECASIGYPVPGGTQLTNPEQSIGNGGSMPQPEPNGLFSPSTSQGTWVMCANDDGTVSPIYIEDLVRTYPYPMEEVVGANGHVKLVRKAGSAPSITMETEAPAESEPAAEASPAE